MKVYGIIGPMRAQGGSTLYYILHINTYVSG
jgi:hypothetical protein